MVLSYTCDLMIGWGRTGSSDTFTGWLRKDGVFGLVGWLGTYVAPIGVG